MVKMIKCIITANLIAISLLTSTLVHAEISSPTSSVLSNQQPIPAFTAKYNIFRKGDLLGSGLRSLAYLENGQAQYSYHTEIEWLIFSDLRTESSTLSINDYEVTPLHYLFQREGTGKDKYTEWDFNPEKHEAVAVSKDDEEHAININFENSIQDKLSYHLQQRLKLIKDPIQDHYVYSVIQNSGKLKNYVYEYDGEEELTMPYGNIKTIRLKREVVEKKKAVYVWFAVDLDYLLVCLRQTKNGATLFEAHLDQYNPIDEVQYNPTK